MNTQTTTGSDAVDLLPCPFCGSANISAGEVSTTDVAGETVVQSVCMDCGACGPGAALDEGEIDYGDVKSSAAWNRRALIAQARAAAPAATEKLIREKSATIKAHQVVLAERDAEIAELRAALSQQPAQSAGDVFNPCTSSGVEFKNSENLNINDAAPVIAAPTAPAGVTREFLERCLSSMKQAVTFGETGTGRPPSQTCMFEIEELEAFLSAPTATAEPVATIDTLEFRALLDAYTEAMRHASLMMPGTVNAAAAKRSALIAHINAKLIAPAPQQAAPLTDAPADLRNAVQLEVQRAVIKYTRGADLSHTAHATADTIIGLLSAGSAASAVTATTEQDAARYRAWRDNMLTHNETFLTAMQEFLPEDVGTDRDPTAPEWDYAIDKASDRAAMAATKEGTK